MDRVLRPGKGIEVPVSAVRWRFDPSGGPGGQHANRSNTRVEATLDLVSLDLPAELSARLIGALGAEVRAVVDDTRSQSRNRELALDRIEQRLAEALVTPAQRRKTRPSRSAKRKRLDSKRRRSNIKQSRRKPTSDD